MDCHHEARNFGRRPRRPCRRRRQDLPRIRQSGTSVAGLIPILFSITVYSRQAVASTAIGEGKASLDVQSNT